MGTIYLCFFFFYVVLCGEGKIKDEGCNSSYTEHTQVLSKHLALLQDSWEQQLGYVVIVWEEAYLVVNLSR